MSGEVSQQKGAHTDVALEVHSTVGPVFPLQAVGRVCSGNFVKGPTLSHVDDRMHQSPAWRALGLWSCKWVHWAYTLYKGKDQVSNIVSIATLQKLFPSS